MSLIKCPNCKVTLGLKPGLAGKTVKCGGCGTHLRLPEKIEVETYAETPPPPPPLEVDSGEFAINCPACNEALMVGPEDVGIEAPCPACQVPFVVSSGIDSENEARLEKPDIPSESPAAAPSAAAPSAEAPSAAAPSAEAPSAEAPSAEAPSERAPSAAPPSERAPAVDRIDKPKVAPPKTKHEPIVLLIHGTFSNLPDEKELEEQPEDNWKFARLKGFWKKGPLQEDGQPDDGEVWWQRGSAFWQAFREKVASQGFVLAGDEERLCQNPANLDQNGQLKPHLKMFKWSSLNNERARYKAGQDLLDRLLKLEEEGRQYHLVGHSHGGSVIWHALQQSMMRRWIFKKFNPWLKLKHLRSWTTVGTPFFHFRPSWIGLWYGKLVTMLLLIVSLGVGGSVGFREYRSWADEGNPVEVLVTEPLKNFNAWLADKFKKGEAISPLNFSSGENIVRDKKPREFKQGVVIPFKSPQHKAPETLWQWMKAFLDVGLMFLIVFGPFLGAYLLARAVRIEARNVRKEFRAQNQAMLDFGGRWLGIWCTEDEAINGLRATTTLHKSQVLPRISIPSEVVFASDRIIRFYRFFIRFFTGFVNKRLVPKADSIFLSNVARGAQGHNRLGAKLIDVTEGPVIVPGYSFPSLPADVNQRLIDQANRAIALRAEEIVAKTRTGFSQAAWGGTELLTTVNSVSSELKGNELIHNSYFGDEFVQDVLVEHMDMVRSVPPPIPIRGYGIPLSRKEKVRKWTKRILWICFGFALALVVFFEGIGDESVYVQTPVYFLSASLLVTGILAVVTVFQAAVSLKRPIFKMREALRQGRVNEDQPKAMWHFFIPGLVMIFCAVFYGVVNQFVEISKIAPHVSNFLSSDSRFAHPGFLFGGATALATVCFIYGFAQVRKNELVSRLSLLFSVGLVIGMIWAADAVIAPGWSLGLAVTGALMLGFYKVFNPLQQCADIISMPRYLRGQAGENDLPLNGWLASAKQNALETLQVMRDLKADALPDLERPNSLGVVYTIVFAGLILMTCGTGVVALPLILMLSLGPLQRACRGARGGRMAAANFHVSTFAFVAGVVSLFVWFAYDQVKVPPANAIAGGEFIELEDGSQVLAAVFGNNQVCRWDVSKQSGFQRMKCDTTQEWDFLTVGSDKKYLVGVSGNQMGVWNVANWKLKILLEGHEGEISGVDFDPSGNLVSAATDGNLIFWDIETGAQLTDPGSKGMPILCLDANANRKSMVVGLKSGEIAIWNTDLRSEIARDFIHRRAVTQILYRGGDIFSIDKNGDFKRSVRGHDSSGKLKINRAPLPDSFIGWKDFRAVAMAGLDDEKQLAVAFTRRKKKNEHWLTILSLDENNEWAETGMEALEGFKGSIRAISFSSDMKHMTVRAADGKIHFYDRSAKKHKGSFEGAKTASVNSVRFSPDGTMIASGHKDNSVWFWDVKTGAARSRSAKKKNAMYTDGVKEVAFSPDGKTLAGIYSSNIGFWEVATGESKLKDVYANSSSSMTFSPDSKTLATASYNTITIWDMNSLNGRKIYGASSPNSLAFSPDGNTLASGTSAGGVRLWDVDSDKLRTTFGGQATFKTVDYSPSGEYLASATYSTIIIWNVETGARVDIERHSDTVNCVAFSPDGSLLASASDDDTIRLWDPENGELINKFDGISAVKSIDFSPDGKTLISGSEGGTIRLWTIDTGDYRDFVPIQFVPPKLEETPVAASQ